MFLDILFLRNESLDLTKPLHDDMAGKKSSFLIEYGSLASDGFLDEGNAESNKSVPNIQRFVCTRTI